MDSTPTFKNLKFNPFNIDLLINNLTDPDVNLFNENNFQNMDTPYLDINEVKNKLSFFKDSN